MQQYNMNPSPAKRSKREIIRWALIGILAFSAIFFVTLFAYGLSVEVPTIDSLEQNKITQSTKIYDRKGEVVLYEVYGEQKRTLVHFDEIPQNVKNATIAIEDARFYSHPGISVWGILRAIFTDAMSGQVFVQGGSTITQQLVKNTFLSPERTITRKLKEAVIALKVETVYSKDQILELYLNDIPYGSNAYGIEAASQTYFGKHAHDLSLAEAATLAAIPRAPTYYSPYGNNTEELLKRKNIVLDRMAELNFITDDQSKGAKEEKVKFIPKSEQGMRAPHFVMHVLQQLSDMYGEDFIKTNGLKVITSLDLSLQKAAEDTIKAYAPVIEKNYNASNEGLVAIDPKTGQILAMVGSRDYFDIENEGNFNVTLAKRQPGSAFKPIVYAAAFKKGYTPDTVLFDVPTEFAVQGATSYRPQNYDEKYEGPISLRSALAESRNVPAVKLLYLVGIKDAISLAQSLGISTIDDPKRYGLSLVLGGGEVTLTDLTSAYGVFANDGMKNKQVSILTIEKSNGEVLFSEQGHAEQVLDPQIARTVSDVLSDNNARAPAFGSNSALYFAERPVAVKTGTTNDYRDTWVVGYTPNIAVGVWAGNNDNSPMQKKVAGFVVAPIWHDFLAKAFQTLPAEQFKPYTPTYPDKAVLRGEWRGDIVRIDRTTGQPATETTRPEDIEMRGTTNIHTILYWVDKNNPLGPPPANPAADSQFYNWEIGVQQWAQENGYHNGENQIGPFDDSDLIDIILNGGDRTPPSLTILAPEDRSRFAKQSKIRFRLRIQAHAKVTKVEYYVNDILAATENKDFATYTLDASKLPFGNNPNPIDAVVKVKVYDENNNQTERSITLTFA
jgi:1A family penicillin-binding protein